MGLGKLDCQKIEKPVLVGGVYVLAFAGQNALKAQSSPASPKFVIGVVRALPIETFESDENPFSPWPPMDIGNLHSRVLQVGRSALKIFLVEDHEFQCVHGVALPPPPS